MYRIILLLFAGLFFVTPADAQSQARTIINDMVKAMDRVQTLTGRVKRRERWHGKMLTGDMRFKLMRSPHKIYVYNYAPDEGAELLWVNGWNNNKVFVHPNKFPWVNVSLNLYSGNLIDEQHHNLMAVGFEYTNGVVKHLLKEYGDEFDNYVTYKGKEAWYGKQVHVIKIEYDKYEFNDYTVKGDENLFDIDQKLRVPAYKIMEINDLDDFFDVKAGQKIKVPNVYAKEMVVMVDEKTNLPIVQLVYDDEGLMEKYEYHELKVNPRFMSTEFSEDFEEYGF